MRMLKLLTIILLLISPLLLHIWRKNLLNNLNIRIENLRREVSTEWNNVVRRRAKYIEATSVPVIERRASEELNMRYPKRGEIKKFNAFRDKEVWDE